METALALEPQYVKRMLHTSDESFRRMHVLCDSRARRVSVPRDMLMNLLMDHSGMMADLGRDRVETPASVDELLN